MTDHAELRRLDDSEVEQLLDRYIKRFPGEHKGAMSRYFEAVHQELAPLARKLEAERDRLKAENDALRKLSAEAYQVLGALDAPENVLDNASDAANGVPLRHETLLPFFAEDYEALRKDAARYRWLRGASHFDTPQHQAFCKAYGDALDYEIDAAIEGATQ
ncbi:hypothetical protein ACUVZE_005865 [Pseudomonas aeruginosa]